MFLLAKLLQNTADAFTLVFYRSLVQIAISLTASIQNGEDPLGQAGERTRFWLLIRGGFGAGKFGWAILDWGNGYTAQRREAVNAPSVVNDAFFEGYAQQNIPTLWREFNAAHPVETRERFGVT